ncbi:MAG: HAMP domain-containing sensor histidine kinase [Solirubrobacterales bacterium]
MRRGTLLTQVLAVNLLLIAAAVLAASIASNPNSALNDTGTTGMVLGFALAATVAVNVYLLSRRFEPLEQLVDEMESADLTRPADVSKLPELGGSEEVRRIGRTFREMLERLEAERRQGASTALEAQERERARIALDLHDEVNQALTGLLLRIEALRRKADPELATELAETAAVAATAMEELVTIARQLRPTTLDDLGLEAALSALVDEVGERSGIPAAFHSEGDVASVPDEIQLVAYRVAQEALSNAIKHGEPEHLGVRLVGSGPALELRVVDDGSGYEAASVKVGLGIAGMRERALLCGGQVEIDSEPGAGTRVRLRA